MKLTLLDIALRSGESDPVVGTVESLIQANPILQNMPFRGIKGTTMTYKRRVGLPDVSWVGYNQGVDASKSKIIPVVIECKNLDGRSTVDRKLAVADPRGINAVRAEEDSGFVASMGNAFNLAVYYGDNASDPNVFDGTASILDTLGGTCVSAGGSGTSSSIYAFSFRDAVNAQGRLRAVEGLLANGSLIAPDDMGLIYVDDADGKQYRAYVTEYEWGVGYAVYDTRSIGRLCNITSSKKPTIPLLNELWTAMHPFTPDVLTCSKTVYNYLQDLKGTSFVSMVNQNPADLWTRILTFNGCPILIDESISDSETQVS